MSFLIFINNIYELCNIKIIDDHLRENINDIKLKLVSHFFFWKCEKKSLISLKLMIFKYSSQLMMKLCSRQRFLQYLIICFSLFSIDISMFIMINTASTSFKMKVLWNTVISWNELLNTDSRSLILRFWSETNWCLTSSDTSSDSDFECERSVKSVR